MKQLTLALVFALAVSFISKAQNVGVGTNAPDSKLEVKGVSGDENSTGTLRLTNTTGTTQLRFGTLDGTRSWIQTIGALPLHINRLGNNVVLNETGGNVGIGIPSPAAKLHVLGTGFPQMIVDQTNGHVVLDIRTTDATNFAQSLRFYRGGVHQGEIYTTNGDQKLRFYINGADRMQIDNAGNVRIPLLSINSPVYTDGSSNLTTSAPTTGTIGYWTRTGTNLYNTTLTDNVGIGTSSPQKRLDVISPVNDYITVGANTLSPGQWTGIHFGYRENNTVYRKSAIVFERTDNGGGGGNAAGKIYFLNGPATGSGSATLADARMTIGETGNVGIGITSPQAKLDVRRADNTDGDAIAFGTQSYYMGRLGESATTNKVYIANTYNHDFSFIDFRLKGNTESHSKMIIKGDGNVGIGTTDPAGYRLNVQQGALYSLFQSTSDAQLELKGTNEWAGLRWSDVGGSDYIWFWGATGTYAIGSGGSTVSGKKLHVHGGTSIGTGYAGSSVPSNGLAVEGSTGIGTNTPSAKLHVATGGAIIGTYSSGSVNRTLTILNDGQSQVNFGSYPYDWSPAFQIQNNDNSKFTWISAGGSGAYSAHNARYYTSGSGLDFYTGSNAFAATISSAGNVGIGNTGPAYKLDVSGQIYNYINTTLSAYTYTNAIFEQANSSYNAGITLRNPVFGDGAIVFGRSNGGGLNAGSVTSMGGYVPMYASGFVNVSDITMKKDVEYLNDKDYALCLDQIRKIQSIRFRYHTESASREEGKQYRPHLHLGVVAQSLPAEVADSIDASAASATGEQKLGMSLADMSGLMVAGMKALDLQNQMLLKEIEALKQEVAELKKLR